MAVATHSIDKNLDNGSPVARPQYIQAMQSRYIEMKAIGK